MLIETMDEWGMRNRVKCICFDLKATSTGAKGEVCIFRERYWPRAHDMSPNSPSEKGCGGGSEIMLEKLFSTYYVSKSHNIELPCISVQGSLALGRSSFIFCSHGGHDNGCNNWSLEMQMSYCWQELSFWNVNHKMTTANFSNRFLGWHTWR